MISDEEREQEQIILEGFGLGLTRKTVELAPWSSLWQDAFRHVCGRLKASEATFRFRLEHVGSTAIEGCPAKPVLDMMVIFQDEPLRDSVVHRLEAAGFTHRGECGVKGRSYFNFYGTSEEKEYVHVHAYPKGHPETDRLLRFRDILSADPELREEYCNLKRGLKESGVSRKEYLTSKTELINRILETD